MASNVPNTCPICQENFSEGKFCPRILPCSHCLCERCINILISRQNNTCPFCRKSFEADSAQNLPMNRYLLDVLKYVEELERNFKPPADDQKKFVKRPTKEPREVRKANKINMADCERNKSEIETKIDRNSEILSELLHMSNTINTDISSKLNDIVMKIDRLMSQIRVENDRLMAEYKQLLTQEKSMKELDVDLQTEEANSEDDMSVMEKATEINDSMKDSMKDLGVFLVRQERLRQNVERVSKKIESSISIIQEALDSIEDEEEVAEDIEPLIPGMAAMAIQDPSQTEITVDAIRRGSYLEWKMIQQGKMFVVQLLEGRRRFARISYSELKDRLYLHCLREEECAPNVSVIKFNDIMSLADTSSRLIFLDLGIRGGRRLGRILIRLVKDSNFSVNFVRLCTGEMGPSYANSNIATVYYKNKISEQVKMGDYEGMDGMGGKPVLPGIDWESEWYRNIGHRRTLAWEKGSVGAYRGESYASLFCIYTKDNPGYSFKRVIFGKVEEGLDILTETISKYPNINDVRIVDCGIVLKHS